MSYENSFNAIKKDIAKETVDKKIRQAVLTKEVIPIEEKPNKPKDKLIVKGMQGGAAADNTTYVSQRSGGGAALMLKQELKNNA